MRAEHLDAVLAIERASFSNPWSRRAFLYELRDNRVADLWVARSVEPGEAVVGYLCAWLVADELHITNLAVHPEARRQGVARHLLGVMLEHYRSRGAVRATLEVRLGNVEARRLYETFRFRQIGVRRGYYYDTGEDALLMEAEIAQAGPAPGACAGNP